MRATRAASGTDLGVWGGVAKQGHYRGLDRLFSKLWALSGCKVLLRHLTCRGVPKWDPNFGELPE